MCTVLEHLSARRRRVAPVCSPRSATVPPSSGHCLVLIDKIILLVLCLPCCDSGQAAQAREAACYHNPAAVRSQREIGKPHCSSRSHGV